MNYSNAEKVAHFQKEVLGSIKPMIWRLPSDPLQEIGYLTEEISEIAIALQKADIVQTVDALMDLLYFAYGLGFKMGIPVDDCFQVVHLANMQKQRGKSKRGLDGDTKKPEGWVDPKVTLGEMHAAS